MAIAKVIYKSSAEATPEVWMDTTDKTAAAGNMLNGITALKNDGTTATGTITSQAGSTVTPSESEQTVVAAGTYVTGTIKVGAIPANYGRLVWSGTNLKVY